MKNVILSLFILSLCIASASGGENIDDPLMKIQLAEKNASDTYSDYYDIWRLDLFSTIAESKSMHMKRISGIISNAEAGEPLSAVLPGKELVQGSANVNRNLKDALFACALIEEQLIKDLGDCGAYIKDEKSKKILAQIKLTSGKHLKEIIRSINSLGEIYHPGIITESELDNILGAGTEI